MSLRERTDFMQTSTAILLVRTYAFMGRKLWMFAVLSTALGGVMAYQLFMVIHEILRTVSERSNVSADENLHQFYLS
jgi:hypothetical protein